jgi:quercetin dioxygenase-like cupin family protein
MNVQGIVAQLKQKYPRKEALVEQADDICEIVVELEPTKDHPEKSVALAIVGKSKPHYHKVSTEIYEVIEGILVITVDGNKYTLQAGEKMTILPNQIHSAEGDEAWFLTYSTPGWTVKDHILL